MTSLSSTRELTPEGACAFVKKMGVEGILLAGQGEALFSLARGVEPGGLIVEIGAFKGLSTCLLGLGAGEDVKIVSIDPFDLADNSEFTKREGKYHHIWEKNIRTLGLGDKVECVKDFSYNVAKVWTREIDLLFLDGDHSPKGVLSDVADFVPFVRTGGYVAMHDYGCGFCGVDSEWQQLLAYDAVRPAGRANTMVWGMKL